MDALHPMTSTTFEHARWFQMLQAPPSACIWNDRHETIDEGFPASAPWLPQHHLRDDLSDIAIYAKPQLHSNFDITTPVSIGNHTTESVVEANRPGLQHGTGDMDGQDVQSDINCPGPPLPPPPPSDSSSSSIDTTGSDASGQVSIDRSHRNKYHVEYRHESLRDAQDDLVGHRFRLGAKRDELRVAREDAGIRAGAAFSSVQKFLRQKDIHLPDHIAQEFSDASALRDKLGQMDAEYDEKEQDYNFLEWNYTKTERAFVEDFTNTLHISHQTETAGVSEIRQERDRELQDLTRHSFTHALPDLIDDAVEMDGSENSDERITLHGLSRSGNTREPMIMKRQVAGSRKAHYPFGHVITAEDISTISKAGGDDSAGQIYHPELYDKDMDDLTWWKLSMRHWTTERPSTFVLHPEESTVSNEDAMLMESRLATESTRDLGASIYRKSVVRSHDMNMLPGLHSNDETEDNAPITIEPIDIGGSSIEVDTPQITVQDVEQGQNCPVMESEDGPAFKKPLATPGNDKFGERPTPQRLCEAIVLSPNNETPTIPHPLSSCKQFTKVNRDLQSLPVPPSFVSPGSNSTRTRPHSPMSNPERSDSFDDSGRTRLVVATSKPLSPPNTRSPSPEIWIKCPFSPFLYDAITPYWSRVFHLPRVPICSCTECDQSRKPAPITAGALDPLY
ncbi:hypothetical protein HBI54_026590 [Parastagonospora nodorum]|nr:hypothetical protein HBI78_005250 [Parastagonospora nodorum]KAH6053486.1 hypothetical protein HBI54_026590 [Parastagonospora nodorum]